MGLPTGRAATLVAADMSAAAPSPTDPRRRPASDFGTPGVLSTFRGPYCDGPPPQALETQVPSISGFGLAELRRMIVIYVVLVTRIVVALAWRPLRRQSTFTAASEGTINAFIALGPTFVKLGQVIASSPGIFPEPLARAAHRTLDEVPPFPAAIARGMVAEDLGRPVAQIFRSFDDVPLSAASIGQVHACVLADGREAVIKLQRPRIRKVMTTDLRIAYRLAKTAERRFAFARNANAVGVVEDLYATTFDELNPALEAWRQHRFREKIWAFGDNRWVTAPEVYWDYCGPRLICMERMSGIPLDDFDDLKRRGVNGELVLRRGGKTWLEAVVIHGPFHGDMHAGNLWLLDDGRSSFLDFGIMGELPDEYKALVKDLFYTFMIDQDFSRIARAYKRLGLIAEDAGTDEEVGQRLQLVMSPMLGPAGGVSLGEFVVSALNMMKSFGMTAPRQLMLVSKQLLYIERYTKGLAPGWQASTDLFLIKNIFPEAAARRAAEIGFTFPPESTPPWGTPPLSGPGPG
ncbi:MAG TPA: AarF/UbiB family protein [Acidimicrobiales bacterium]|nr:AarF/UbiB family protein [Acidimicrobiales bacterium]